MDTSEYMPMFLAEAQEHLQELNLAIVRLEENPRHRETVDEIFRIAHSLKGMSATMGFAQIATLTHEMEDVFELLRQRNDALPREAIDTVLACLDGLSASFDAIEADGKESLDPAELIERLHGLARARTAEQEVDRAGGAEMPDLVAATAAGERVLHVVAMLSDQALMPAVRAHMVFAALSDHGHVIGGVPATDEVEQFSGERIEAWIATEHEEEVVAATVATVSDVIGVEVGEVAAPRAVPDPEPAAEIAASPTEPVASPAEPVASAVESAGADVDPSAADHAPAAADPAPSAEHAPASAGP
ncbi:MAG: Hpt domain-containing protein, partial [Solirubrobacteraceae bacterium]